MIFHCQKHTKFARDMISAGLFPLTLNEETLCKAAAQRRKSGTSANPCKEQMKLKEKTLMITQPLLDAQRVTMTRDSIGSYRLSVEQAATSSCGKRVMEPLASHLGRWLRRWLRLRSLLLDLSWHRSNCLLVDGLLRQWMLPIILDLRPMHKSLEFISLASALI